jgi:hypothetical protein
MLQVLDGSRAYLWDQSFLQGALFSFVEEQYLETKIWVLGVLLLLDYYCF